MKDNKNIANFGASFKFGDNFDVRSKAPLDGRLLVKTIDDLTNEEYWNTGEGIYLYDGIVVTVKATHEQYMLYGQSDANPDAFQDINNWHRVDAGGAEQVEVVDDLETADSTKALSANQGVELKSLIDDVNTALNNLTGEGEGSIKNQIDNLNTTLTGKIDNVSTAIDDLTSDFETYKSEVELDINDKLSAVYTYKGSCTYEELPASGNKKGDVYNVTDEHDGVAAGTNYVWDGNNWDALAGIVDLSEYATKANVSDAIDTLNTNVSNKIDEINTSISNIDTSISNIKSDISDINDTITTHAGKLDNLLADIDALIGTDASGNAQSISGQIDALRTEVAEQYVKKTTYTTDVSNLLNNITNISGRLDILEGDEETVGSVTHTVKTLLVDYVEKEDGKELISAEKLELIDTNAADIASLTTTVNANSSAISTLTTNVSTNTTQIATINETLIANSSRITAADSRITAVEDKLQWATLD